MGILDFKSQASLGYVVRGHNYAQRCVVLWALSKHNATTTSDGRWGSFNFRASIFSVTVRAHRTVRER